jgi:hypothetical protein
MKAPYIRIWFYEDNCTWLALLARSKGKKKYPATHRSLTLTSALGSCTREVHVRQAQVKDRGSPEADGRMGK